MQSNVFRLSFLAYRGILSRAQMQLQLGQISANGSRTISAFGSPTKQRNSQIVWNWSKTQHQFSTSTKQLCEKSSKVAPSEGEGAKHAAGAEQVMEVGSSAANEHFSSRKASDFDKRLLVFFGKYKSVEEVPSIVSIHVVNSTRNKFRIYVNMFIGFLTVMGCGIMIYKGRVRSAKGESLSDHNMRRHPVHYQKQLEE